jgi:hypothetical protein
MKAFRVQVNPSGRLKRIGYTNYTTAENGSALRRNDAPNLIR